MKIKAFFLASFLCCLTQGYAQKSILHLHQATLMNEVRATPSPLNGQHLSMNPPHFMWQDKYPHLGAILDGLEEKDMMPEVTYRIRISQDSTFKKKVISGERRWAFFNPFKGFEQGKWYWQHAFVDKNGKEEWSPLYHFYVDKNCPLFNPPSLETVLNKLSKSHPRILLDNKEWNSIITHNSHNPVAQSFITKAKRAMRTPLGHLDDEIE